MRVRACKQYHCDFCKKKSLSASYMRKHEAACTKNPDRVCGVCTKLLKQEQPSLKDLMALLPDPNDYMVVEDDGGWEFRYLDEERIQPVIDAAEGPMRDLAGECPYCIMAAFRQKGIPTTLAKWLDVKREMGDIWDGVMEECYPLADDTSEVFEVKTHYRTNGEGEK